MANLLNLEGRGDGRVVAVENHGGLDGGKVLWLGLLLD